MITTVYGKLYNEGGELIGEGSCQVDDERGSVTLRPPYEMPLMERQHGALRLVLDDGSELSVSDRVLKFRLNLPDAPPGSVYRLSISSQQRLSPWPRQPGRTEEQQGTGDKQQGDRSLEPGPERDPDDIPRELRRGSDA